MDFKFSPEAVTFLEKHPEFTERLKAFEEEFNVNGTPLKKCKDLVYFLNSSDYPSYEGHYDDVIEDGDGYSVSIEELDFDFSSPKVYDMYYYLSDDGKLHIHGEFIARADANFQTDLRDSGNYYEPPTWDDYDAEIEVFWEVDFTIPEDPSNIDDYEVEVGDFAIRE